MSANDWYLITMMVLIVVVMPVTLTWVSIRADKKWIESYPEEYRPLAKQASSEMWPQGVLEFVIEQKEKEKNG
jgi:hypothetical protein